MIVKLDLSKAYDRVKWGFIKRVMEQMGFHEKWISLIMHCITIVSYSMIINGVVYGCIYPTRGLCQGDPLFSYLFLLYADDFSSLINDAAWNQKLNGVSICRDVLWSLTFSSRMIAYCYVEPLARNVKKLVEILEFYENASGRKINTNKSSVFFSHNTLIERRNEMLGIFGPMQDSRHRKYLGLPSIISKSKTEIFAEVKERVGEKTSWLEGKNAIYLWAGDPNKSGSPSNTNLYHELLLAS